MYYQQERIPQVVDIGYVPSEKKQLSTLLEDIQNFYKLYFDIDQVMAKNTSIPYSEMGVLEGWL